MFANIFSLLEKLLPNTIFDTQNFYFEDAYDQFGKVNLFESDYYGEPYDYFSIMHYDSKSFSKNGRNTIEAKQPGMTEIIGKVKDFSGIDLRKINKMYSCTNVPSVPQQLQPQQTNNGNQQSFQQPFQQVTQTPQQIPQQFPQIPQQPPPAVSRSKFNCLFQLSNIALLLLSKRSRINVYEIE